MSDGSSRSREHRRRNPVAHARALRPRCSASSISERSRGLRHAFGGRVDRREHLFERRRLRCADAPVFGMHDLESERAAAHFAEAAHPRAAREPGLLRAREIEEAQRQRAGAVGDAAQQLAPAPVRDFGELDLAFDHGAHRRGAARRWSHDLRAVFVAQRQHEQQVLHLRDAELLRAFRRAPADAAQRGDRPLLVRDLWRGRCHGS